MVKLNQDQKISNLKSKLISGAIIAGAFALSALGGGGEVEPSGAVPQELPSVENTVKSDIRDGITDLSSSKGLVSLDRVAPYSVVLKAVEVGQGHYLLTDLQGVTYTVYGSLTDGGNYIVYQGLEYELLGYEPTERETDSEALFNNESYIQQEKDLHNINI